MRNTRIRTAVLVTALAAVVGAGGAAAYFSDTDSAVNTFTVGKIDIDLTEPSWHQPDSVVPDQEIPKDPVVKNEGGNDAFVFLSVKVPTANIVTAAENGARQNTAETQLFGYAPDENWTLVSANVSGAASLSSLNNRTADYGIHTAAAAPAAASSAGDPAPLGAVTYVYAYTGGSADTMQRLEANATTPALFPAVQFVNAVEGQNLENTRLDVEVKAYAIQADFINDGEAAIDGTNGGAALTAPNEVWKLLETQKGLTSGTI